MLVTKEDLATGQEALKERKIGQWFVILLSITHAEGRREKLHKTLSMSVFVPLVVYGVDDSISD